MPKQFPLGFRRDVIEVARSSGLTQAQVGHDFGISANTVQRWVKQANVDDGQVEGAGAGGRDPASCDRVLREGRGPKMMFPLVPDLAVDGFPVTVVCRVLGFSTQAYYRWLADPVSRRGWDDAHLSNAMIDVYRDDPEFG